MSKLPLTETLTAKAPATRKSGVAAAQGPVTRAMAARQIGTPTAASPPVTTNTRSKKAGKHEHKRRSVVPITHYSTHESASDGEEQHAYPMCLPVELQGVSVGHALVDQGATRTVIRRTALAQIKHAIVIQPVRNMFVLGSTGKEIPIIGRFTADLTSQGRDIGRACLYIVDNTPGADIICNLVIGKATLATSAYPYVDVRGMGALYNEQTKARMECLPGRFARDSKGVMRLTPRTWGQNIQSSEEKGGPKYDRKVAAMSSLVTSLTHLGTEVQEYLLAHLLTRRDAYRVDHKRVRKLVEKRRAAGNDGITAGDGSSVERNGGPTNKDTDREWSELMSHLTYVPRAVSKGLHQEHGRSLPRADNLHTGKEEEEDEVLKNIEDIEYPYTSPTERIDTPEYHKEKERVIREMVGKNTYLTRKQKEQLIEVVLESADRLSIKGENMTQTDVVQHEINTGTAKPFRERLRQYSPAVQKIIDAEVQKMIDQKIVIPSKSPYASNLLLVRKPDPSSEGGVKNRVCVNFVRLNQQTEKDSYPLAVIQYIFDKIGKSKWFTTMDLLSGFWQVMIKPEHRHKTAFVTMRGLYEFVVMAFGLCNAPATFQRLMDQVILPEYRSFIETYIDDLMTHSNTFEEHLQHLRTTFSLLRKNNLMVKLSKCKFAQQEVKFLGHLLSQGQLRTNPESVAAIQKWERPAGKGAQAVKAVRGFLGMTGWYRKFIPYYADIAKPLIELTKKSVKWAWTPACQAAFETLRDALTKAPVLAVADPNKSYVLHTDASDIAMSAILMQEDDNGDLHPIAFASKVFNDAQRNYDTTAREALALVWGLEHYNTYVEGHKYVIVTDHHALEYIKKNVDVNKRITRLSWKLQPYELTIKFMAGKYNHAADLFSREHTLMKMRQVGGQAQPAPTVQPPALRKKRQSKKVTWQDEEERRKGSNASPQFPLSQKLVAAALSTRRKTKRRTAKGEYEVEKVIGRRAIEGRADEYEYQVRWKGYGSAEDTWEPLPHLRNAMDKVVAYEAQRQEQAKVPPKEEQSQAEKSEQHVCGECGEACVSLTHRLVHQFHAHGTPVPDPRLDKLGLTTDRTTMRKLQEGEPEFRVIYNTDLGQTDIVGLSSYERRIMDHHEFVRTSDGLLYCIDLPGARSKSKLRTQLRLCVPATERKRMLNAAHNDGWSGHPGVVHTYDALRERVWWPRMLKDVVRHVGECELCQRSKGNRQRQPTQPVDVPYHPWSHVAVDHVGPLPTTDKGNVYILVVVDRFTRYAEAFPMNSDPTAADTAEIIINNIVCRHGLMHVLQSDRGTPFVSQLAAQIYSRLGVKQVKTAAHHPQSNGVVEVLNRTLKGTLRLWANENQTDWDVLLPYALFAYNTAVHSLYNETPFYLQHGRQARGLSEVATSVDLQHKHDMPTYAKELVEKLKEVHDRVREILVQVNEEREEEKNEVEVYEAGDKVLLYQPQTKKGLSRKLVRRWTGPYTVVEKHSNVTYTISKDGRAQKVNIHRLRRYKEGQEEETLTQKYEWQLQLAEREMDAIAEAVTELLQKKENIEKQKEVLRASKEVAEEDESGAGEREGVVLQMIVGLTCPEPREKCSQ